MAKAERTEAEKKKQEVAGLKTALAPIAAQLVVVEEELNAVLVRLPNLPPLRRLRRAGHPKIM